MSKYISSEDAHELALFAMNNEPVFRRFLVPVVKSLARKYQQGVFDTEQAVKAFYPVANEAAKAYVRVTGSDKPWNIAFPAGERHMAARELLRDCYEYINGSNPL